MKTEYKTNRHGFKFYLERSGEFGDDGIYRDGRGWFAGLMDGRHMLSGVFFETRERALDAIHEYAGPLTHE